jgi:ABC-type xylose transport system permease subunit
MTLKIGDIFLVFIALGVLAVVAAMVIRRRSTSTTHHDGP